MKQIGLALTLALFTGCDSGVFDNSADTVDRGYEYLPDGACASDCSQPNNRCGELRCARNGDGCSSRGALLEITAALEDLDGGTIMPGDDLRVSISAGPIQGGMFTYELRGCVPEAVSSPKFVRKPCDSESVRVENNTFSSWIFVGYEKAPCESFATATYIVTVGDVPAGSELTFISQLMQPAWSSNTWVEKVIKVRVGNQ